MITIPNSGTLGVSLQLFVLSPSNVSCTSQKIRLCLTLFSQYKLEQKKQTKNKKEFSKWNLHLSILWLKWPQLYLSVSALFGEGNRFPGCPPCMLEDTVEQIDNRKSVLWNPSITNVSRWNSKGSNPTDWSEGCLSAGPLTEVKVVSVLAHWLKWRLS